jgi:hypothetical protein
MKVTKKDGLLFTTVTWEGVPGAEGYRLYSMGTYRSRTFDKNRRSARFSKGHDPYEVEAIVLTPIDRGSTAPGPPPPPPPPPARYAPMTHHVGDRDQDPCYCMRPEYGVVWDAARGLHVDAKGATYDEKGRLSGGRDRSRKPPMLKGAESMDGLEPCDQYVGPTGMLIGGSAGYPPESYEF